MSYYQQTNPLG